MTWQAWAGQAFGQALGRPGRSLTRRLIWLASAWMAVALVLTGWMLTSQYQDSALRRMGYALAETIDEVVLATTVVGGRVSVAEIQDSRTLRPLSGKYWVVGEFDGRGGIRILERSPSLAGEDLLIPADMPARLERGRTLS